MDTRTTTNLSGKVRVVRYRARCWAVRIEGEPTPVFMYRTQGPAISHGMALARRRRSELVVQGRIAQSRQTSSYGNEPFTPRG